MNVHLTYSHGSRRDPELRASDADREAIGDRLRRHHAEGRLDSDEFATRLDGCYAAKTLGELDELVRDLPPEEEPHARRRFGFVPLRIVPMVPLVPLFIALITVSAITGHGGFWFVFPLLFFARFWFWGRWQRRGPWHSYRDGQVL
jgi:hypothetical protein